MLIVVNIHSFNNHHNLASSTIQLYTMRPFLLLLSILLIAFDKGVSFSPSCNCQSSKGLIDTTCLNERKPGVSSPEQLKEFVNKAGPTLIVIDVRIPDDVLVNTPCKCNRPKAINLTWDKESNSMEVPFDLPKDTPIITHCNSKYSSNHHYILAS